ncbi:MAG: VOC family protein [Gemmatimonadaceae bacterium]
MEGQRTLGIHHITLVTGDARRALGFYGGTLGLRLVKQTVNFDDPSAYHLYFGNDTGAPGTIVTFFEWPQAPRGRFGVGGVHHLAFGTATYGTLLQWKRYLSDRGVAVTGPLSRGYFTSLYFKDPDGQVLEIATAGPGYDFDEPLDQLGRLVITPDADRLPGGRDAATIAATTHPEPVPAIVPAMALSGLHHISGITDDVSRAGDFIEASLGLRLVKQTVNQDDGRTPHWFWARYDGAAVAPHSAYTLFEWKDPRSPAARDGRGQAHHIAFRAADDEEQGTWRERLLSNGIAVSPVMDRTYFRSIYFRAPDGQLLEVATDGPGFAADEPTASLGATLKLPAWLEEHREAIEGSLAPLT